MTQPLIPNANELAGLLQEGSLAHQFTEAVIEVETPEELMSKLSEALAQRISESGEDSQCPGSES